MITFIAFVLTILGCINWLMIGLLQYDFIAGLFGFQASIFSRIVYILFGVGAVYLFIRVIANKGTFKIFERKKNNKQASSQTPIKEIAQSQQSSADNNQFKSTFQNEYDTSNDSKEQYSPVEDGLFDEHFQNK